MPDPQVTGTARVPRLSYFFPGAQRGGQSRGARHGGARDPADPGRGLRDHRRRRRLAGPDAGDRRCARGGPPGCRPRRAPPDEPRLRGRTPVGFRGRALRPRRVHRRRPPVQGRRSRSADRPDRGGGQPDVVVGFRIKRADPLIRTPTRAPTVWPTGSSSASRSPTSTAPASSSGARRSRGCASNPAAPSSRPR